jgi:hypothetical protein
MRYVYDIEATGLLDNSTIDYTKSPYELKPNFKAHCVTVQDIDTGELFAFYDGEKYIFDGQEFSEEVEGNIYELKDYTPLEYVHKPLTDFKEFVKNNPNSVVIGHNIINYDNMACKLLWDMDYTIADSLEESDSWCKVDVTFVDTMMLSKTLNPDRWGGHSLEALAKVAGQEEKFEFRKNLSNSERFVHKAADMIYYCLRDCVANTTVYHYLEGLKGNTPEMWDSPILLEKQVAEIVTRQSHRGFNFNKDLAEEAVEELDGLMKERRERVDPLLPPRKATKAFLDHHTPSSSQVLVKEECFPKAILNKNTGLPSANLAKFVMKHEGELDLENRVIRLNDKEYQLGEYQENHPLSGQVAVENRRLATHFDNWLKKHNGKVNRGLTKVKIYDKVYNLPMKLEPIKTEMIANIEDTTHIKGWLVELGWNPTEWAMRDISLKTGTKIKRTPEELEIAITRYVEETLESPFCNHRCTHLGANRRNLRSKIEKKCEKFGCKVLTTPKFTIGQDKELCPNLEAMSEKFPYAKDIVEYLTYRHRRNTILGGNIGWDEIEEAEKGYLANIREDGRIPTPADTCGASTARMKHKVVANVPRPSSLYGEKLRGLFGVDKTCYQIGWDFPSLEARMEGHRCWKYDDEDKSYCKSLLMEKPNDVHTRLSKAISTELGSTFSRDNSKSVKYGLTYGATWKRVQQIIGCDEPMAKRVTELFWEKAYPLNKFLTNLAKMWETKWNKKYIKGLDGRLVPTRAKHSTGNSQLQSDGALCAKQTIVYHDRLLRDEGLLVDFFKDDWKNKSYCQQMIAYHDEAQLEATRDTLRMKSFKTKEEAQEFKDSSDRIWSSIKEKKGKYFIGYSRAGELVTKAVEMTVDKFKLNVPLCGEELEYDIGLNWKDCH